MGTNVRIDLLIEFLDPENLPRAAIISAIDQAMYDILAKHEGMSLCNMLGQKRDKVELYANINRRTKDRSPASFATSACVAIEAGFRAVKIAPFDEVEPDIASLKLAEPGLARISDVKDALSPSVKLFVDCHWRFSPAVAMELIRPLSVLGVTWYECPILETEENIPYLRRLRKAANDAGMVLAGLEKGIGSKVFETFAHGGAYDVMMPDIKYIGGLANMMETAKILNRYGVAVSPHNPTGPVCHVASLAVCGSLPNVGLLELQFDETHYFSKLVGENIETPTQGSVRLPTENGLGVMLERAVLQELPYVMVNVT